jgi:hypothetical protein
LLLENPPAYLAVLRALDVVFSGRGYQAFRVHGEAVPPPENKQIFVLPAF